ncbi:MAG: alpha/beta hydrolase family protein [Candidatus Limnocylindrales bacterium]
MRSIERSRRLRTLRRAATLLAAGLLVAACSQPAWPTAPAQASPNPALTALGSCACGSGWDPSASHVTVDADDGAHIKAVEPISDRIMDLTIQSPAMGGYAVARLILPADFDSAPPSKTWPVLMLLHGATRSHADFSDIDAAPDALIVAPDGGAYGYYSDWWNGGKGGPPAYETFHLVELPQLVQRSWRASTRMAIAGISMGGFGAMSYAGRHPGMFVAAASISGVVDTRLWPRDWLDPNLWGSPTAQADVWKAHNPADLVSGLRGTTLFVSYGNGQLGPLDPASATGSDTLEALLGQMNEAFTAELKRLGIPATIDAYGPGTHTGPYFDRELAKALPILRSALTAAP